MMALKTGSSTTGTSSTGAAAASPESSSSSSSSDKGASRQMISKNAALRRRRSKGGSIKGNGGGDDDTAAQSQQSNSIIDATNKQSHGRPDPPDPSSSSISASSSQPQQNQQLSSSSQSSQPQQPQSTTSLNNDGINKPCHAARLALLCCQNAARMGSQTQLGLCPPGRIRKDLKAALRQKNARTSRSSITSLSRRGSGGLVPVADMGGYFGVDKMMGPDVLEVYAKQEEEFLNSGNGPSTPKNSLSYKVYEDESEEEASSGDDDDLSDLKELLLIDEAVVRPGDDERKYATLIEPLFTPIGAENMANAGGGPMQVGGMGVGKLPFNRRKLRYFDSITARDTTIAREYLQQEMHRSKKREVLMLAQHLKRTQRMQRRQLKEKRGQPLDAKDLDESESAEERSLIPSSVAKLDEQMTPAVAAALMIESLEMNPLESIEGMAKCYEGIVAAGVALLEAGVSESAMSPSNDTSGSHVTRSEIMAALTPLLITSLEQPSGDVILLLAKLRRMCGTARYQRRFVQRIAPSLIRPPRGAMWCLRHQNDMEPILAAAELIFDSAFDVFSKGWYDRGQLLLADSKRAETLSAAAMQLKNLSSNPHENLTLDLGHSGWRSNKYKTGKEAGKGANEPLAEWEVIAVDRQIRVSISNIISMDWSKIVIHSREAALSTTSYHRTRQPSRRPSALLQATSSGDMSPNNASPARQLTPRNQPFAGADGEGGAYSASLDFQRERSRSPIPTSSSTAPLSPPPPSRKSEDAAEGANNLFPSAEYTPPRSPSTKKEFVVDFAASPSVTSSPASPKRGNGRPGISATPQFKESISNVPETVVSAAAGTPQSGGDPDRAPLSPLSVGTATPAENVSHRPMSSASSVGSSVTGFTGFTGVGTQPSNYRMLTSTVAERKRTVAACRALRAQITRFEEAFIQLHGRPPKGANERAPLATTYAQYREWKRAIRADAACRIQALFRGASIRWKLLRSNDPRASRVVLSRAGRRSAAQQLAASEPSGQDPALKDLSIHIGDNRSDTTLPSGVIRDRYGSQGQATGQSRSPQWGGHGGARRRSGSGSEDFSSNPSIPRPVSSPSASVRSAAEIGNASLPELQSRKRDLKQQLKQYDMDFARRHGRMPVKAEKEPIRHLYEKYNALKSQITMMEQEGRGVSSPLSASQASSAAVLAQRTISPVGSDSEESGPRVRSHGRGNRAPSLTAGQTTSQDLGALKAEKGRLHQMLRSYERDFYREHQRQVSSFADIRPVASQYRRYKEIKKAIAALQSGERGDR